MSNKLSNPFCILIPVFVIFSIFPALYVSAQPAPVKQKGSAIIQPPVTTKWNDYKKQVEKYPAKKMVELSSTIPGIVYDLRYASANNFMKRLLYPPNTNITFLRQPAALALLKVQQQLNEKGLGLKIFDAYRPYSVTIKLWKLVKDKRYVANPAKGSGHNRGIAVDLTIIDLTTGEELDMGTGFDNFTDTAHHRFMHLPKKVLQNRLLLKTQMKKNGFRALETEWWHYYLADGSRFELLDIPFIELKKTAH